MKSKLPNIPPKGTSDWMPEEYAVRQYIFDTWRRINKQFGYQEYHTPILESADIYRVKSGEDVGGKELMIITDQAGRELAIRPEMTPSVTRMVTRIYQRTPKPLRLFSIANFWRNERPQRGRNREFWQLNTDIFGSTSINVDLEILQIALQIMLAFNPPQNSFTLYLNHRRLIDSIVTDIAGVPASLHVETMRTLDKFEKLPLDVFQERLIKLEISPGSIEHLTRFMECETVDQLLATFPQLIDTPGYQETKYMVTALKEIGYGQWVQFKPSLIRGFDYYDGMIFEVFDNHSENNRSLFGGGRYNSLANVFVKQDIPAVGFAPGDEPTRLFLEVWNLIPEHVTRNRIIYLPLLSETLFDQVNQLARALRENNINIELGLDVQTLNRALKYANNRKSPYIILLGPDEVEKGVISLKNMETGKQENLTEKELVVKLKNI